MFSERNKTEQQRIKFCRVVDAVAYQLLQPIFDELIYQLDDEGVVSLRTEAKTRPTYC